MLHKRSVEISCLVRIVKANVFRCIAGNGLRGGDYIEETTVSRCFFIMPSNADILKTNSLRKEVEIISNELAINLGPLSVHRVVILHNHKTVWGIVYSEPGVSIVNAVRFRSENGCI